MYKRIALTLIVAIGLSGLFFVFLNSEDDSQVVKTPHKTKSEGGIQSGEIGTTTLQKPEDDKVAVTDTKGVRVWLKQWQQTSSSSARSKLLKAGVRLATQRAAAMKFLIRNDPDEALNLALSYAEYAALPKAIQAIVEEPFSDSGSIEVTSLCSEHQLNYRLEYASGDTYAIFMPTQQRISGSKKELPIQGIRLEGLSVLRHSVFQILTGENATFVQKNWPIGQRNPQNDYATGDRIEGEGITVVAGGHVFHFQNEENLKSVETALQEVDAMPSHHTSSQWILTQVNGDGFPFEDFSAEMVAANYATTTGDKTALIIMVNFQDVAAPANQAALEQAIDVNVSNALAAYSYNTTSMDASVYGTVVTISSNAADYLNDPNDGNAATKDYNDIHNEAVAAYLANEAGGTPTPSSVYDTVCVYFGSAGFGWAGLASVGGQRMWLQNTTNDEVILHEFGHNYGLSHANYWVHDNSNAASTDPVDPSGASAEYGDDFDVMGSGSLLEGHFHMGAKQDLGWIGSNDWEDISGSGDNGTYRIYRFDHINASGTQALRIAKAATSDHYWIGYRKDYASLQSFASGAYLTWERAGGSTHRNQSWLVDTTPQSAGGKNDAPITLGRTYSDTASDVHITPVALGGSSPNEYIDVVVNFGPFVGNTAPTGSISGPTATNARQVELFSASATDLDDDTLAYSWDMGDGVIHENSATIVHNWASGGIYDIAVTVSDMKGGSVTLTKSVTVSDPLTSWSTRSSGTTRNLNGIASNSTHAVVVGDNQAILRSSDGSTWDDESPSNINLYFNDIIWTGAEFIAVGQDYDFTVGGWESVIYTSPAGQTWTRAYESNTANTELNGIAYDGSSTLVAVGESATILRKSGNGAWMSIATTILGTHVLQDIAYGGGSFVLVGHDTASSYNGDVEVRSSTDGLTWTDYSANTGLSTWKDFSEIEYVEGAFHAGGFYSLLRRSTDAGQSWSTSQNGDRYELDGIASISGVHYGVGRNWDDSQADTDFLSSDGISWTVSTPGSLPDRNEIEAFADTFISVGDSGSIRQSGSISASTDFSDFITTYFSGGGSDADTTANSDGDWANNFIEYALGGDPTDDSSVPSMPALSIDSSGFPIFEVTRSVKQADVAYSIWWSTNLSDWTQEGLTIEVDDETTLRVRSTVTSTTENTVFFRLQLNQ